mmetsp:Transcript_148484/g.377713  ORF Transcript_148484/g.377713 Transcript_148484/m.377713 type:complete len:407 (+) Transcript_148484:51-1271(+)
MVGLLGLMMLALLAGSAAATAAAATRARLRQQHASLERLAAQVGFLAEGPYSSRFGEVCAPQQDDRAAFERYKAFHKRCRVDEACRARALVWNCNDDSFCGGLGDEIRGLSFMLYLAMAVERPLFVRWRRMGHDMLDFFTRRDIDVRVPDGVLLGGCRRASFIDSGHALALFDKANTSEGCDVWTTNLPVQAVFKEGSFVREAIPVMEHISPVSAIGCAMRFMFQPMTFAPADQSSYEHIPAKFVAIHFRCADNAMGRASVAAELDHERDRVRKAMQCAESMGAENVVFVSCSESAKRAATEVARDLEGKGMGVYVSGARARHIDHDHTKLTEQGFRTALWSDFVLLQQAEALIFAGRISGFSGAAASMGLVPASKLRKVVGSDGEISWPPCKPVEEKEVAASTVR